MLGKEDLSMTKTKSLGVCLQKTPANLDVKSIFYKNQKNEFKSPSNRSERSNVYKTDHIQNETGPHREDYENI